MTEVPTRIESVSAPPGAAGAETVDLGAALFDSQVQSVLDELDRELVGLRPVKTRIREIASLLLVERLRNEHRLTTAAPTLHMCFTGGPGTGKTTVALRMASVLHHLGFLPKGHLVVASRDDLVGQYVGHTAPKTKEMLKRAKGGVLFIDEAYYLYRPDNERDYGQEAIEVLLQAMEQDRDDLVVILAGYRDRMDAFFQSNAGLHSRIAHHIDFPEYTLEELMAIAELLVARQMYEFDDDSRRAFEEYLCRRIAQPHFSNARSVRNAVDRIKLRHASRLVGLGGRVSVRELSRIDAADVRRSRVFDEAGASDPANAAPAGQPGGAQEEP